MRRTLAPCALFAAFAFVLKGCEQTQRPPGGGNKGRAWLLETLPEDTSLELVPGTRYTHEALISFLDDAKQKVDFSAMYWHLLSSECSALRGRQLWEAIRGAAARGVKLRALCGTGISGTEELEKIQKEFPEQVTFQVYNASSWYGSGIMHMKLWIFDDYRTVITSANMDCESLSQVKELGVALEGRSGFSVVEDVQRYFDRWWAWTNPSLEDSLKHPTMSVFDPVIQRQRTVPCWLKVKAGEPKCLDPLPDSTKTSYSRQQPMRLILNGSSAHSYITCSPAAVCDVPVELYSHYVAGVGGRTWDADALVQTIFSARRFVAISVMDFMPIAVYGAPGAWWPVLNDALLAKLSQGLEVRLLISRWAHTAKEMEGALQNLNAMAQSMGGSFQLRYFEVPGWNETGKHARYPPFSRVNHAKYIVTDNRFNIGTSNMEWSYFHTVAGTSFNSDNPLLRAQLVSIFNRDWNSGYAKPAHLPALALHPPESLHT